MEGHRAEQHLTRSQEKRLLRAAAAAIKTEFPNLERCGCPELAAVRNLAQRRIPLPETGDLVDHIATCALCFDAYTRFRRRRRAVRVGGPILAFVVCMIVLALLWPHRASPVPIRPPLIAELPTVPVRKATLDYRGTSPTRSAESQYRPGEAPRLPRAVVDLSILLPIGTEDGAYSVELRASSTRAVIRANGTAKWDGRAETLATRVDLRQLAAGEYALALRKDGSSWRTYRVILEEGK
jgi:hypothetical protein